MQLIMTNWRMDQSSSADAADQFFAVIPSNAKRIGVPPLLRNSRLICRLAIAIDLIRGIVRIEPIDRLIDVVVIDFKIDVVVLNFKIKNPN